MLDFLLRRTSKTPAPSSKGDSLLEPEQPKRDDSAKLLALSQSDQFAQDEVGAVAFILACGYADARLRAAEHVRSKPLLEQVLQAMRKSDRRVAKLMQARLDDIRRLELTEKQAQDCIAEAQRLAQDAPLMANLVADLDRRWQLVAAVPASLQSSFDQVRQQIAARLAAQASLQRSVIDGLDRLRQLEANSGMVAPQLLQETLDGLQTEMAQYHASPEAVSLPKSLSDALAQAQHRLGSMHAVLERHFAAVGARQDALAVWEAAELSSLDRHALEHAWGEMPPLDAPDLLTPLQQRFDALLQPLVQQHADKVQSRVHKADADFPSVLAAMEHALQEGALHVAVEQDEILRSLDMSAHKPGGAQLARLADAQAELKRLQGWAKWGGNVSREELIKAIADLSGQSLRLNDLAKMVGVARQEWKALDTASGAAPKVLWERFDAACNAAYAPVAEHAKKQSQERQQNRDRAERLLADLRLLLQAANPDSDATDGATVPDWKEMSNQYRRAQQSWQRLGQMDRKDRKRLDAEFEGVRQRLLEPLRQQWQQEIARRESLIEQAEKISPDDRGALDRVRQLQARWQESARSLPLERQDEQPLWQRFRSACDTVFAKRTALAKVADAERRRHSQEKKSLCAALEAALEQPEDAIRTLLRESDASWGRIGAVAHAVERPLEQRYRQAVAALRARLDAAKTAAQEAEFRALLEKLDLCQAAEAAVVANLALDAGWAAHWQMLPLLAPKWEALMRSRFEAAHASLQSGDREYAAGLESARLLLAQELLRLEILAGLPSPPEFSRERLQMQVDVLQSALAGEKKDDLAAQLERLCGLAALADEQSTVRLRLLLEKVWCA